MTIKEKIGQLYQNMHGWNAYKIQNNEVVLTKAFQKEVDVFEIHEVNRESTFFDTIMRERLLVA